MLITVDFAYLLFFCRVMSTRSCKILFCFLPIVFFFFFFFVFFEFTFFPRRKGSLKKSLFIKEAQVSCKKGGRESAFSFAQIKSVAQIQEGIKGGNRGDRVWRASRSSVYHGDVALDTVLFVDIVEVLRQHAAVSGVSVTGRLLAVADDVASGDTRDTQHRGLADVLGLSGAAGVSLHGHSCGYGAGRRQDEGHGHSSPQ